MFEISSPANAKLQDVRVLVTKDREPDTGVGAQLVFAKLSAPAQLLAMLSPLLPQALFRPSEEKAQQQLEGMPASLEPSEIGEHAGWIRWSGEGTGYTLRIDYGIGGESDLLLTDCKLHRIRFKALDSGGTEVGFVVDAPNVSAEDWGVLVSLKTEVLEIKLQAPQATEDEQQALDLLDKKKPAAKKAKPSDGTKPADWPFGTDGTPQAGQADDPEEGRMGESDPGEAEAPAAEPRRRRGKAAPADATEAFTEAHAPRRRRGKGEAPATH